MSAATVTREVVLRYRVADDSPLKKPPMPISERQIMLLDGIRHATDMASIAHERLWAKLCYLDSLEGEATSADLAEAALDAWSIVDAAHRLSDLIANLPGLSNAPWRKIFLTRMAEVDEFRNDWQHQTSNTDKVLGERGQTWGALAWHKHWPNKQASGRWYLAVIGSDLKGSQWFPAGPTKVIPRVDSRRIRLLHCNREIYLSRLVFDMFEAVGELCQVVAKGELKLVGECVNQSRDKDWIMHIVIQVLVGTKPEPGVDDEIAEGRMKST